MERIQSKLHPDICSPTEVWKATFRHREILSKRNNCSTTAYTPSWKTKEKNIWLGTKAAGLFQLTPKGINRYSVTCFKHQPNNPYSISDNSIYSIFQDSHNRIWIGCYGGGLNLLIRRNDQTPIFIHSNNELKNYPTDYGMKVRNITEAPGGVLMVSFTNGLLTFSNKFELPEEVKVLQKLSSAGR